MVKPKSKTPEGNKKKTYRNYELADLISAAKLVKSTGHTVYKASKQCGVPYNTLKDFLIRNEDLSHVHTPKMERPFALTSDIECKIFNYIVSMQELGFGLTVIQIRKLAFDLAEKLGRDHFFNKEKKIASKWWWGKFKERYNLCLRTPENLSRYRASMTNSVMVQDYFQKLNKLLTDLDIKNQPNRIWNVDETGLAYVVKPNKVVCQIGKKYVYKRTYAERGQLQTVVCCVCADGSFIPPMVIFKGVRWNDNLKENSLPNSLVKLSPKGWINSDLFFEWFRFFIDAIPPVRPVILLMDSHGSHIGPEVIDLAKHNEIYLMTFPAHTSHIFQPLDVGVYKSLKNSWGKILNKYMIQHPNDMPNRYNFHELFNPAFLESFSPLNIVNSFKKAGACPYDPSVVPSEALAPSKLTDSLQTPTCSPNLSRKSSLGSSMGQTSPNDFLNLSEDQLQGIEELIKVPHAPKSAIIPTLSETMTKSTSNGKEKGKMQLKRKFTKDSSAKCLNPPMPPKLKKEASKDSSVNLSMPSTSKGTGSNDDEDWKCGVCLSLFSKDVKQKNGAKWLQCSFCLKPYHELCQTNPNNDPIYMCDTCEPFYGDEDSN